jgi:uncharacterized protein (TIGR00730 family)
MSSEISSPAFSDWGKQPKSHKDRELLKGPCPLSEELIRVAKVCLELVKGVYAFRKLGPCITIFGSARFDENTTEYIQAAKMGSLIAQSGLAVMTGGGPGIMEAANRGAKDAGGKSLGCNITLPEEQHPNPYLDTWVEFEHFHSRKLMLLKYSSAFIVFPGGYGTLDELFETLVLIQTGKIRQFPLVLIGVEFWTPLIAFLNESCVRRHTIKKSALDFFLLTDDIEQAMEHLKTSLEV